MTWSTFFGLMLRTIVPSGQQKDGAELKSYLAVLHKMTSSYIPILNLKGTTIVLLYVIKGFQVRRIQSNP